MNTNLPSGRPYPPELSVYKILGNFSAQFGAFLAKVYRRCLELEMKGDEYYFVVFITRRCHVLSEIYFDIFQHYQNIKDDERPDYLRGLDLSELERIQQDHFITDTCLLGMCGGIANRFSETLELPHVILVDEILLHGRAINGVLTQFENEVIREIQQRDRLFVGYDLQLRDRLMFALDLRVFAQNDKPLLLLPRYQRRLEAEQVSSIRLLRELSKGFAQVVATSRFNNVAYSWSLRSKSLSGWRENLKNACRQKGFVPPVVTNLEGVEQWTCLRLYPNVYRPQAICTVRFRCSGLGLGPEHEVLLAVPFIIHEQVPVDNLLRLHRQIESDLPEVPEFFKAYDRESFDPAVDLGYPQRWVSETNDLVLCAILWHNLFEDSQPDFDIDFHLLAKNFLCFEQLFDESGASHSDICIELRNLWRCCKDLTGKLETYLDILLEAGTPVWEESWALSECDWKPNDVISQREFEEKAHELTIAAENSIVDIAYRAERNAYEKFTTSVLLDEKTLSSWGQNCSYKDMLAKAVFFSGNTTSLRERLLLIGIFTQEMDLGIMGMSPRLWDDGRRIATTPRAGEQSLFILPKRYQDFIPTLIEMRRRCGMYQRDIEAEIGRFLSHVPASDLPGDAEQLTEELTQFVKELDWVGQSLSSWDLPIFDYIPIKEDGKTISVANNFLRHILKQNEYVQIYQSI